MHYISKPEQMLLLQAVKDGSPLPSDEKYVLALFELEADGFISMRPFEIQLTYFGFRELEAWDPVLCISTNDQLIQVPYGDA